MLAFKRFMKIGPLTYDVTIMQTPKYGEDKGYSPVYRLELIGDCHEEVLSKVYSRFNVSDLKPKDFTGRYISTGDIVLIDEGTGGMTYYRLEVGGWVKINRACIK
ncbi:MULTISPECIES: YodL domain-containing protein [Bacillus]|uniref:YodL domain-containing protein n=1 Tax=Bacillus TaxID=1386 RepID=UPI000BB680FE|nr:MULTISPECIES: YodL domain-containing protein [Bacillus]